MMAPSSLVKVQKSLTMYIERMVFITTTNEAINTHKDTEDTVLPRNQVHSTKLYVRLRTPTNQKMMASCVVGGLETGWFPARGGSIVCGILEHCCI